VSQTAIDYRGGGLEEGRAGRVGGGDRLPWVSSGANADNFAPLASRDWQVHVYGVASPALASACAQCGLALHAFQWSDAIGRTGLARDAAYLVRPDGYVALADPSGEATALLAFVDKWRIRARAGSPATHA
jgi:hypothetical protein